MEYLIHLQSLMEASGGTNLYELLCNFIFQMDSVSLIPGLREKQGFTLIHVLLSQLSITINKGSQHRAVH